MLRFCFVVVLVSLMGKDVLSQGMGSEEEIFEPPIAKTKPHLSVFHGDSVIDNYHWMRQKKDADVINYLSSENGYAQRVMKSTTDFQRRLYKEMRDRFNPNDVSVVRTEGNYDYYSRREKGKDFPIYCRKKNSKSSAEEVIIDLNQLAEQSSFVELIQYVVSPDQNFLAYSIDFTGSGKGSIYIKNLKTGAEVNDDIHGTGQLIWGVDTETIYYTSVDSTNRSNKVYRHKVESSVSSDRLIYEEPDSTYRLSIYGSNSGKYLFMISQSSVATECRYKKMDDRSKKWNVLKPRKEGIHYVPEHYGEENQFVVFYRNDNKETEFNGSIKTISLLEKKPKWIDYIPARDEISLENYAWFEDFVVMLFRENGLHKFRIAPKINGLPDWDNTFLVDFPEVVYSLLIDSKSDYYGQKIQFKYTSFTQPITSYEFDFQTRKLKALKQSKVVGYDSKKYEVERIWATASDGKEIPISLVYKKGLVKDGSNPLYLNGYGAFGISADVVFDSRRLSLLDRGVIYAIAHVRGGAEMGFQWHADGRYLNKMNTFTDFFSCTEKLIEDGYTSPEKLVCQGASSGGLLVGAALTMRPELYKGVIINVPFLDVINTQSDPSIPVSALESYEWGDPAKREVYDYMKKYSPYDNIQAIDYPNVLVQGGFNDLNVAFWEAPKFVAKMRSMKTDSNLLLLNMNMTGGHGLTSGRNNNLQQAAFEYAFIFKTVGIKSDYSRVTGIVRDRYGEPMPYVNVIIKNTTSGTTTNSKGEYALELKNDMHALVFRHVGFESSEEVVDLTGDLLLNITLDTESVLLKSVEINSKYEDPAYAVIKAAIDKRKTYLKQMSDFSARVYIRADNRFDEIPEKRPFFIPKADMPDSSDLGLMYLSESEARLFRKRPDWVKEVMVSSKVAGNSQGYSWNRAGDVEFNFYKNIILIKGLSERGFVSPIANNALLFYKYEYIGIKEEKDALGNDILVNKIKVIPRRKNDPVFHGHIYIAEDSWRISALDLGLEGHQIEVFDDFKLKQNYIAVSKDVWMPLSINFYMHLSIFGFGISGSNVITYSDYELNPEFPPKFFNNEIFKIEKEANVRDTTYWLENRPVTLSADEIKYYIEKDKVERRKQSKVYLDSVDRAENKTTWQDMFDGFWYYRRYTKETFSTNALFDMANFNTVEGLNLNFKFRYQKGESEERHIKWVNSIRYGFSNRRFNATSSMFWTMDRHKHQSIEFEGGRFIRQVNNEDPIYPIVNTFYSLARQENYMKLYGTNFGRVNYKQELWNGVYLNSTLTYEDRTPLVNTTNYSFKDDDETLGTLYTSNDPVNPDNNGDPFTRHQALVLDVKLKFFIKQKYMTRPNSKVPMDSKYPKFTFSYKKGIPIASSDVNYDFTSINMGDDLDLGLFGKASYDIGGGKFFNTNSKEFIDYKHFNGNQTLIINYTEPFGFNRTPLNRFQLLNYYSFSTNSGFLEGHFEYHGNGFVVNKLPILRKSKFQAVGGVNVLFTQDNNEHVEFFIGLENVLKILRIDFATGYNDQEDFSGALRFRLGLNGL